MYDQTEAACFDPNSMPEPPQPATANSAVTATTVSASDQENNNGFSHHETNVTPPFTPIDHLHHIHQINPNNNNNPQHQQLDDPSMENNIDHHNHHHNIQNPHLGTYNNTLDEPNNWPPTNINVAEMGFSSHYDQETPTSTTDLLTLLHLPRCSNFPPTPSLSFGNPVSGMPDNLNGSGSSTISYDPSNVSYDPLFHLNLPPQPSPLLRDLMFQSLPHGYGPGNMNGNGSSSNSLFSGLDEGDQGNIINGVAGIYHDGHDHNHMHPSGIFEFTRGNACLIDANKEGKGPKNFVTERQRRANFNDKYQTLRQLVPSPTKGDRASIVGDAISYINELKRTVSELKLLVEKKRISKERVKRLKNEDAPGGAGGDHQVHSVDGSTVVKPDPDEVFNGSAATQLRSSWLSRKCKDTEVDVRIVDDEVTIKLVQRKKINCLLSVSRTLDELQLDLSHVAGGHVGDYYSYLFNTKICEGSSVYASAIANKLIEVVEKQYATASVTIAPTNSF